MALHQIRVTVARPVEGALYALSGSNVTIVTRGGDPAIAGDRVALWKDAAGTMPQANPLAITDGVYSCWLEEGDYDEVIDGERRAFNVLRTQRVNALEASRGAANGVAPLDAASKLPVAHLPPIDVSHLAFDPATESELGVHDASQTAHPALRTRLDAVEASNAGKVPYALFDAKGDLLVGTGPDTATPLLLGADGHVLTADSTQPAGVKWAAVPGGTGGYVATRVSTAATDGTDAAPQLQSEITAMAGTGVLELVHGKTYTLGSGGSLKLPRGAAGLRINLNGATLKLTAGCRTAFAFERVADHDTFQNVTVENGTVDADNVAGLGRSSVILGATGYDRVNWKALRLRKLRAINIPVTVDTIPEPSYLRFGVQITTVQNAYELVQNRIEDILIEDVKIAGGLYGFAIYGTGSSAANEANVYLNDITVRDCEHTIPTGPFPNLTGLAYAANVHIGSYGYGGRCLVENFHGTNSPDVGCEINGFRRATLRNVNIKDANQSAYLLRNYNTTWATAANITSQIVTLEDCDAERDNLVVTEATKGSLGCDAYSLGGARSLGHVVMHNCSVRVRRQDFLGFAGRAITTNGAPVRSLTLSGKFTAIYEEVNANPAAAIYPAVMFNLDFGTGPAVFRARDIVTRMAAVKSGTNTLGARLMLLDGDDLTVDIDGWDIDWTLTGSSPCYGVSLGDSTQTINGRIARMKVRNLTDNASSRAVYVDVNWSGTRLDLENNDWSGMAAQVTETQVVNSAHRAKIHQRHNRYKADRPITTITAGASPYVYQNTTSIDQNVIVRAGTVSLIETSVDGATYESTGETAGVFPVPNGYYLRVTHTAAPTMRGVPVR